MPKCDMVGCNSRSTELYYGSYYCAAHYPREKPKRKDERRDAPRRKD